MENRILKKKNSKRNKIEERDKSFHDWYRFVLSFPPHLVDELLLKFKLDGNSVVLDPFCGTGTTLVEAKIHKIRSIGIEASPFAHFVTSVKINWNVNAYELEHAVHSIKDKCRDTLNSQGIIDEFPTNEFLIDTKLTTLSIEQQNLLLKNSISPIPLHKAIILLHEINKFSGKDYYNNLLLAFAKSIVYHSSNLRFGPEVGIGKVKNDAPVISPWVYEINKQISDLKNLDGEYFADSQSICGDSRKNFESINSKSIDAVITSPPYPNEKDYSRTTRLESVLLGFITNRKELQAFKKALVRSNTRGVYKKDDDEKWIAGFNSIQQLSEQIENRRNELNKTSGFEKLYSAVTKHYFGGMYKHLLSIKPKLKRGAKLAYVVGDQASYLRVLIRTGNILAELSEDIGYKVVDIELFRTRFSTATGNELREEILILENK